MPTVIPFGSPQAVIKWSGPLFVDYTKKSYWERKFVSTKPESVIQRLTDLESGAGDTIHVDLSAQLRQKPVSGDNRLEGREEQLRFYGDDVYIDQLRTAVSAGGRMTRKRTLHDLRKVGKDRLSDYWAKYLDELKFIYLSGARGINEDFTEEVTYAGHATNPLRAPDSSHILYGGNATAKDNVDSGDTMTRALVERAEVKARMMRSADPDSIAMMPVMVDGEAHYVLVMSLYDEHNMRQETGAQGWLEIQKAAAGKTGSKNPIFQGGLGMLKNVVLHSHENVIRFSDYGTGSDVEASRSLFLGRQAGVVAYGSKQEGRKTGRRFTWKEEQQDYENEPTIAAGLIIGISKTRFNGKDYGVIALDCAAADPN